MFKKFAMITLLAVACLTLPQTACEAKLSKSATSHNTWIQSQYYFANADNCWVYLEKERAFNMMRSANYSRLTVFYEGANERFAVTRKDGLDLIAMHGNTALQIKLPKASVVAEEYVTYNDIAPKLTNIFGADRVLIKLTKKSGGTVTYVVPSEIVREWETVLAADLKQIRRELEG